MNVHKPISIYRLSSNALILNDGKPRGQQPMLLFDGQIPNRDNIILYNYFNDVYKLFLKKISDFAVDDAVSSDEKTRLKSLLSELIKVKDLIQEKS